MSGPFGEAALELRRHNLAPLPLGGGDGKRPLIKFGQWKQPQPLSHVERLVARFHDSNVGIVCGPSKITVLDCDDAKQFDELLRIYGPTPIVVETPSGGMHGYYRSSNERCRNLRSSGFLADVKGIGGQVAAAPSTRPSGEHAGRSYRLVSGSWSDLASLPRMRPEALSLLDGGRTTARSQAKSNSGVCKGHRNDWMFGRLMREARSCDDFNALLDVALGLNTQIDDPLPDEEVAKIAASVWNYEERGENWCGGPARSIVTTSEWAVLKSNPKALALLTALRLAHGARGGEPFAISAKALERHNLIPGWQARQYRAQRNWLIEQHFLLELHVGGSRVGDASLFCFAGPMGAISYPRYNRTPAPRSPSPASLLPDETWQAAGNVASPADSH